MSQTAGFHQNCSSHITCCTVQVSCSCLQRHSLLLKLQSEIALRTRCKQASHFWSVALLLHVHAVNQHIMGEPCRVGEQQAHASTKELANHHTCLLLLCAVMHIQKLSLTHSCICILRIIARVEFSVVCSGLQCVSLMLLSNVMQDLVNS